MAQYELPDGWKWIELQQAVRVETEQILPSKTPSKPFNYLALENITQGTGQIINFSTTSGAEIKSNKFKFTSEHVLYGKLRPYLRKAVAPDFEGISATDLLPLKPEKDILNRHFLMWWLLSPQILEYVLMKQTGVKMPRLRAGDLKQMPVPLPPLAEQKRIVVKIEELFEQRDTARAALDGIPPLLKKLRQRVLADAFAGRLTERRPTDEPAAMLLDRLQVERRHRWEADLRAKGKDSAQAKYKAPAPPDTSNLSELPEGWVWASLGQWFTLERGRFSFRPRNEPRFYGGKYPFVQIGDLPREGGEIKEFSQTLNDEGLHISKMFSKGTALIAIVGATIANTGILTFDSCCPDSLVAIQSDDELQLKFIEFYLRSKKYDIRNESYASGGQPNISLKTLLPYPVPLPPLEEQQRIVVRIEALFAQVEAIETAVDVARRQVVHMEQAVLTRAFRGQLVPQKPHDQPASVLLEHIQTEQAQSSPPKKKKSRKQAPAEQSDSGQMALPGWSSEQQS